MNQALFLAMFKQHGKKALHYATGLAFYNLLLIGVYPTLSKSLVVNELSLNLPNSVKRIFGVTSGNELTCFESYVSSQCFGRVGILVTGIYTINTADALIAKLIDHGEMAYLLASPVGRFEVLTTQAAVLVSSLTLLVGLNVLGVWAETRLFAIPAKGWSYFRLGVLELALFLAVGSYSLFFSALFNSEEHTLLSASSLTFLYYALEVFAELNDRFSWAKNVTIFGWVRPQKVLEGEVPTMPTLGLLGVSTLFIALATAVFSKKDLPV